MASQYKYPSGFRWTCLRKIHAAYLRAVVIVKRLVCRNCRRLAYFDFAISVCQKQQKHYMQIRLTNEQKVQVTLEPKTDAGKPVTVENPVWSVVSGDATLDPSPDGLSCWIISPETPGQSQILIEADADLGAGVEVVSATIDVDVAGAKAAVLGLAVGTPTLK